MKTFKIIEKLNSGVIITTESQYLTLLNLLYLYVDKYRYTLFYCTLQILHFLQLEVL